MSSTDPIRAAFLDLCRLTIRHGSQERLDNEERILADLCRASGQGPDPVVMDGLIFEWLQNDIPGLCKQSRPRPHLAFGSAGAGEADVERVSNMGGAA